MFVYGLFKTYKDFLGAELFALLRHLVQLLLPPRHERQLLVARGDQVPRDGSADPGGGSGQKNDLLAVRTHSRVQIQPGVICTRDEPSYAMQ